jgi:hypothetical protein
MNPPARPCVPMNSAPSHRVNVQSMRENKNIHAVALGSMTSKAKSAAAQKNGVKGGRPEGS